MDNPSMIMIVSMYNLTKNISMEIHDRSEWLPIYLYENSRRSSPKESVPDLIGSIFI